MNYCISFDGVNVKAGVGNPQTYQVVWSPSTSVRLAVYPDAGGAYYLGAGSGFFNRLLPGQTVASQGGASWVPGTYCAVQIDSNGAAVTRHCLHT